MPNPWVASCSISVCKPYSQGAHHGSRQFYYRRFFACLRAIRCHQPAIPTAARRFWACLKRWRNYYYGNLRRIFIAWIRYRYFRSNCLHFFQKLSYWSLFIQQEANLLHIKTAIQQQLITIYRQLNDPVVNFRCLFVSSIGKDFSDRGWFWILRRSRYALLRI